MYVNQLLLNMAISQLLPHNADKKRSEITTLAKVSTRERHRHCHHHLIIIIVIIIIITTPPSSSSIIIFHMQRNFIHGHTEFPFEIATVLIFSSEWKMETKPRDK